VAEPLEIGGAVVEVGASIGIALATKADGPIDDLLQSADSAMYEAKGAGKGRWRVFGGYEPGEA
jgi:GGDEF domain-containing protein